MKKSVYWKALLSLLFVFAISLFFSPKTVFAKNPVNFDGKTELNLTFDNLHDEDNGAGFYYNDGYMSENYTDIATVVSTDKSVATCTWEKWSLNVHPVGIGNCDVTATDVDGNKAVIHVKVKPQYFVSLLRRDTRIYHTWYGSKKLIITSTPGTNGKVKVGRDTYKFAIPKTSEGPIEEYKIRLKKVYPLKTKIRITASNTSNGQKYTMTRTEKIGALNYVVKAAATKKKLKLTVYNLHKGDIVQVIYKGKKYKKTIKKNRDSKNYSVTFKTKKKLTKRATFKVKILNKSKKTLDSEKIKLSKWKYEWVDPDEKDPGSE